MRFGTVSTLALVVATSIQAQASAPTVPDSAAQQMEKPYRDPHTAVVLGSLIPGAGYAYAGDYLRGYITAVGTIGGMAMGPVIYEMDGCTLAFLSDCDPGPRWPYRVAGILAVGSGIYTWISSARESRHAAERANVKHAANARRARPILEPTATNGWNAGLTLNW
jgi:hypothetical protein